MSDRQKVLSALLPEHDDSTNCLADKVPLVFEEIERTKRDLSTFLSSSVNVSDLATECESLLAEGKLLTTKLHACENYVRNVVLEETERSVRECDAVKHQQLELAYSLKILSNLVQCGKHIEEYEEHRRNKSVKYAAEILNELADFLADPNEDFCKLAAHAVICAHVEALQRHMSEELKWHWNNMMSWEVCEDTETSCKVLLSREELDSDVLIALDMRDELQPLLEQFARFLLDTVLQQIILHNTTIDENMNGNLQVHFARSEETPRFYTIALNIHRFLSALNARLDVVVRAGCTLMSLIGKIIGVEFGETIAQKCLTDKIPDSVQMLGEYSEILSEAEALERYCVEIGFFPPDYSIMQFAIDVEGAFAEKCCRKFLDDARSIMKSDLSLRAPVGTEPQTRPDVKGAGAASQVARELPSSLFMLPACVVSRTASDLVVLLESMAEQAAECPLRVAERLVCAARLVLDLYGAVVPYHHEEFLLTVPLHAALFHNNCMLLAHYAITAGESWNARLQGRVPVCFLDYAPLLRQLGYQQLARHMKLQRSQMIDCIKSSELSVLVSREVLDMSAERAVRQSLRQITLLHNSCHDILPPNVYTRLAGLLCNVLVTQLVKRVCSAEDIPAEMAAQLSAMCSHVLTNAPQLFPAGTELSVVVSGWTQLQELAGVLSGSLKDIAQRWAAGAGPLARAFSPEQLRKLVRALFQNTQVRANLLADIK